MTKSFSGACACGAIRYQVNADPIFVAHCHCRDCQKSGGGQMATVVCVPKDGFKQVNGETKSFEYTGDSGGKLFRHFCPECGCRMFTDAHVLPDALFLMAGSLDDPGWIEPQMHIYVDSAQPWANVPDEMTQFAKMPEE